MKYCKSLESNNFEICFAQDNTLELERLTETGRHFPSIKVAPNDAKNK